MIRILLVDDQHLVQQGIKSLLDRDRELIVIGAVDDGRSAVKEIEYLRPDIVLLDIEMPGMDGITATKYITRLSPRTKVIILSSHEDKKYVTQALMAGAKGYILKSSTMSDLKQTIVAVNNGYSQINSKLLAKVFDPSNFKSRRRQSPKSKLESKAAQTQKSPPSLLESESKLESNSSSALSGKYQLGTSSIDLEELDKPPTKLPPKIISPSEIIKAEVIKPAVSDRDTFIQDPEYNQNPLEPKELDLDRPETISSDRNSPSNLTTDITDFPSLSEILPKAKSEHSRESEKQSLSLYEKSTEIDLSLELPAKEPYRFSGEVQESGRTKTIAKAATAPKNLSQISTGNLTQYRPVGKTIKSESTVKKLFQKSLTYSWFWNVVLMILGAILVVIIGSL